MCGIAGAWLSTSRDDPREIVRLMCDQMRARGPDADGAWNDPVERLCLGHRRLAIIDLDARANQPMASQDGAQVIIFNGEIYNYLELREQLIAQGVRPRTRSDTEVILELYRRHGSAAFSMLRGMFALAIWDAEAKALVLARDPYGIKPLYVAQTPAGVAFASQIKALAASGLPLGGMDPAGAAGFLVWGSVPDPYTLFRRVRAVPAGAFVTVTPSGISSPTQFAELESVWDAPPFGGRRAADEVREAVTDSVRAHLVADVPVAVLLSGGIDSGTVAGLVSELGQQLEAITIRFDEFAGTAADESARARQVAEHYDLRHTERLVTREEFVEDLPRILAAMDQPSIDGVNSWFAAKAVAEQGYKVVLSGVGGDELLCGYDSFRNIPRMVALGRFIAASQVARPGAEALFSTAARLLNRPKLRSLPGYARDFSHAYMLQRSVLLPEELAAVMSEPMLAEGVHALSAQFVEDARLPAGDQARVSLLESTRYLRNQLLRDSDWASMAHSLELRTPLTDWMLLRRLAPYSRALRHGRGKRMLAAAPRSPLPDAIVNRRKTGFGLPMREWLREVAPEVAEVEGSWTRGWSRVVANSFGLELPTKNPVNPARVA